MKKLYLFLLCLCLTGCDSREKEQKFCTDQEYGQFNSEFRIWCPTQREDNYISSKYGCSPLGEGISIPIRWDGVPPETDRLRVTVLDTTCVFHCDSCCQYVHWVFDIHFEKLPVEGVVSINGVDEGGADDPFLLRHTYMNSNQEKSYAPFCPPKHQTHAIVIQAVAYQKQGLKDLALGRTQSKPLLFSLEHKGKE